HVNLITSPLYVLTNALGLILALSAARGSGAGLEAVFITFSYYTAVTRVVWEFNRVYRNMEGALTDAAQFAELLLDPPTVVDAGNPQAFVPLHHGIEIKEVDFRYSPEQPLLFQNFSFRIRPGTK